MLHLLVADFVNIAEPRHFSGHAGFPAALEALLECGAYLHAVDKALCDLVTEFPIRRGLP